MNKIKKRIMNKGISLIVLVITIAVILILAAAVILSIDNNNPIENAKKAKQKHNESVYQEELELYAMNEYSNENNEGFNKNALNAFNGYNVKKIITSILDEDVDKYIIWQGKLVKKEGDVYKYINGEQVMMFGENGNEEEKVPLTENRVRFVKAFYEVQEGITNEKERLIYNGGYITNCVDYTNNEVCTASKFKEKMPENITIKTYDLAAEVKDTWAIGTDTQIIYNDEVVAKTVFFGDIYIDRILAIAPDDVNRLKNIIKNPKGTYSSSCIMAGELTEDGIIDSNDVDLLNENMANIYMAQVVNQNRPAIMPRF